MTTNQAITTTRINLRVLPGKTKIILVVPKDAVLDLLPEHPTDKQGYTWQKVKWQQYAGYVATINIKPYISPGNQASNKVGLHVISDAKRETFFDVLQKIFIPSITLCKLGWDKEIQTNEIKSISPHTKVMLRDYNKGNVSDNPFIRSDTNITSYVNWHLCCGDNADYYQIINEPSFQEPVPVANFWNVAMDVANKQGKRLGLFCFSERNPPLEFWKHPDIIATIKRAYIHGHCIMRHSYVIDLSNNQGTCLNWARTPYQADKLYRHQLDIAALPFTLQSIPIWVGELGDIKLLNCSKEHLKSQIATFNKAVEYDNINLVGATLWTAGTGASEEWAKDDILNWYQYAIG